MHNYRRMSRRAVLRSAALSLGAATATAVVSQTAAQQKISQADAKYQAMPKGDQRCEGCVNFQPPNGSELFKVRSARTAGANCLSRRRSPNRAVHFPEVLAAVRNGQSVHRSASSSGEATYAYTITGALQRMGGCLPDDAAGSGRARGLH